MDDRAFGLAVAPQAERIAVGVNQIRQRLELVPLGFVMRIVEFRGSAPLPGAFTSMNPTSALLTVTAKSGRVFNSASVVSPTSGTSLPKSAYRCQVTEKDFEGAAKLILGRPVIARFASLASVLRRKRKWRP